MKAYLNYDRIGNYITETVPATEIYDVIDITIPEPLKAWQNIADGWMIEFPDGNAYQLIDVVYIKKHDQLYIAFPGTRASYKASFTIE